MPAAEYDRNNIFARILRDEIPSSRVYEDAEFVAFRDIAPAAPVHLIVIPRGEPPTSPAGLTEADAGMVGRLVLTAVRVAAEQGLSGRGYRLVMNCGEHGGQSVAHLHLHVLGGGPLGPVA
ncbi:MAG: histidine triad nucleotide-binding protein [Dehalococcoidia bacterium]|nr:histidine triad nucleotide-binding protein [Dehalococcoidia bacterium]